MSSERELLAKLQAALARADVDVEAMVSQAWDDAVAEVGQTLRRLIANDLLERALDSVAGDGRTGDVPAQPVPASPSPPQAPTQAPTQVKPPRAGPTATVTYLYGITRAVTPPPQAAPPLPGGQTVRAIDHDNVRAVVCTLDEQVFAVLQSPGPEGMDTLVAAAQGHDSTLAAVAATGTVLPLRLGTVVADDDAVRHLLGLHAEALEAELDRLDGFAEWAVTVHLLEPAPKADQSESPSSGRGYLAARQASLRATQRRRDERGLLAAEIHERLAACAQQADVVATKPVEDVAPPLLHGVYLLDAEQRGQFDDAVAGVRTTYPDARVDVTGPWPPYHFTSVRLDGAGAS